MSERLVVHQNAKMVRNLRGGGSLREPRCCLKFRLGYNEVRVLSQFLELRAVTLHFLELMAWSMERTMLRPF